MKQSETEKGLIKKKEIRVKMDLARASLNYNVAVLEYGAGLLRIGLGGSGVGLGFKVMLLVRHDSLGQRLADI